jgi:hypothetical protein
VSELDDDACAYGDVLNLQVVVVVVLVLVLVLVLWCDVMM